ncbi:hypothetical protein [Methanomassiliicoccus luminyensis]|nr:hypothetical protein [Methanomassiliicoccus luminyensis]
MDTEATLPAPVEERPQDDSASSPSEPEAAGPMPAEEGIVVEIEEVPAASEMEPSREAGSPRRRSRRRSRMFSSPWA